LSNNYFTPVSVGASAAAATVNAPIAQIDAHMNPTVVDSGVGVAAINTTVTTGGTFYPVTGFEASFTPAYTGQVFEVDAFSCRFSPNAAGSAQMLVRITDGASVTVLDNFIVAVSAAGSGVYATAGASKKWTAGAGDVGVTRKAKVYVTHVTNGTVVTCQNNVLQVTYH
jgi:hypothetical protein